MARLESAAKALGRTVRDLAESAVSEAALEWEKSQPSRPEAVEETSHD